MSLTPSLYETDFYAWTQEQVKLLSEGKWHQLDLKNIIEEIESLGKQERQQLLIGAFAEMAIPEDSSQ